MMDKSEALLVERLQECRSEKGINGLIDLIGAVAMHLQSTGKSDAAVTLSLWAMNCVATHFLGKSCAKVSDEW